MWGIVVAAAIVLVCNCAGSVTALALEGTDHKRRNSAQFTCLYYAMAVGILAGVIW